MSVRLINFAQKRVSIKPRISRLKPRRFVCTNTSPEENRSIKLNTLSTRVAELEEDQLIFKTAGLMIGGFAFGYIMTGLILK